jgi:uncharacterized phage infection (PIP) family protein YhgE
MKKNTTVGLVTGFVLMMAFIFGIGMVPEEPFYMWIHNAYYGLAFAFAFGLGVPELLAYGLTLLLFGLTFLLGFFIGKKLSNLSFKKTKAE